VAAPDDSPPAPGGYSRFMYRNVVVAYDGSEVARIALARAAGIARSDGASLTLVEAVAGKVPSPAPGGPPLAKPEKRAMAREDLNRAIERLDPKLEAAGWVIGGPPAKGILTVADDSRPDRDRIARPRGRHTDCAGERLHRDPARRLLRRPRRASVGGLGRQFYRRDGVSPAAACAAATRAIGTRKGEQLT
jgi:hypothetical protein